VYFCFLSAAASACAACAAGYYSPSTGMCRPFRLPLPRVLGCVRGLATSPQGQKGSLSGWGITPQHIATNSFALHICGSPIGHLRHLTRTWRPSLSPHGRCHCVHSVRHWILLWRDRYAHHRPASAQWSDVWDDACAGVCCCYVAAGASVCTACAAGSYSSSTGMCTC
jgi:hypothetical protein